MRNSVATPITANPGGGHLRAATLVQSSMNVVDTVAAEGDSVKLPPASVGATVEVTNLSLRSITVFGDRGVEPINGMTSVRQMAQSSATYLCTALGTWICKDLSLGHGITNGIVAAAGGGQANAVQLSAYMNRVTTVAAGNDSVKLPPAQPGMVTIVVNAAAANSLNVFPQTGESINALAANAAFAMVANKTAQFFCVAPGVWNALLTA